MINIKEYITEEDVSPFAKWFNKLNVQAALKVNTYLTRIGHGNFSTVKSVGKGVYECRIDFGPGYRVYFGKDGDKIIILLGGGTKKRQPQDIAQAYRYWEQYKKRRKEI